MWLVLKEENCQVPDHYLYHDHNLYHDPHLYLYHYPDHNLYHDPYHYDENGNDYYLLFGLVLPSSDSGLVSGPNCCDHDQYYCYHDDHNVQDDQNNHDHGGGADCNKVIMYF